MIPKNYLLSGYSFIVALCASILFASCGSYQYVGYENDGIYNDDIAYEQTPNNVTTDANSSSYYKSYFDEKASELNTQEDVIFTDIDSYQGNYTGDNYIEGNNTAYAGWGQNGSEVQINVYNNRPLWGLGFYGFNSPFYGGFYGGFYGNPYFGFGYGFNDPFFNGFGFGYGYAYSPFINRFPFYGYPNFGYPYYGNRFYGNGYYGNSVSYNRGRRFAAAIINQNYNNRRRDAISRDNSRTRSYNEILSRPRATNSREIISRDGRRSQIITRPRSSDIQRSSPNSINRRAINSSQRGRDNTRNSVPNRSNDVQRSSRPNNRSNNIQRSSTPNRTNNIQRSSTPRRSSTNNTIQRSSMSRSSMPIRSSSSRRGNNQ